MAQSPNPFHIATGDHPVPHPCYSQAFEIASAHLPEEDWEELQALVETADTALLHFECFTLPDSDAIGFKLLSSSASRRGFQRGDHPSAHPCRSG